MDKKEERRKYLSKGFTKDELIGLIISRESELDALRGKYCEKEDEICDLKSSHKEEIDSLKKEFEEEKFEIWKSGNGEHMNRFIRDFIKSHLSVKVETDYNGHIDVRLVLDKEIVSSDSDYVTISPNPEDFQNEISFVQSLR